MDKPIRIVVVEDHAFTRVGIVSVLSAQPDLHVCGEAETAAEAEVAIGEHQPDVVVMDLFLQRQDGVDRIKAWTARFPDSQIVVVSMHDEKLYGERTLRAGARGYVMKSEATDELVEAVRTVADGRRFVSGAVAMRVLDRAIDGRGEADDAEWLYRLTDRELHVFQLLGAGLRPREIAERMTLSVKTVNRHQDKLKNKLNLQTTRELVSRAEAYVRDQSGR